VAEAPVMESAASQEAAAAEETAAAEKSTIIEESAAAEEPASVSIGARQASKMKSMRGRAIRTKVIEDEMARSAAAQAVEEPENTIQKSDLKKNAAQEGAVRKENAQDTAEQSAVQAAVMPVSAAQEVNEVQQLSGYRTEKSSREKADPNNIYAHMFAEWDLLPPQVVIRRIRRKK